ncbi:MAG: serine/threonine-protein kinase [Acidimicrobiales bacterium]
MATAQPLQKLSGRYEIGEALGRGGMAEVFDALDHRLGRRVALKMLRPELGADDSVRLRFESEARTAAKLSHPNVVGILDTGEDNGVAYIVLERLPGTTLADELAAGPLPEERTRKIGHQVLDALTAAHDAGIIHRDIKPANVLTCSDGTVKVADFGIATVADAAQAITHTGLLIGTPAYLAPERLDGKPATASTDLYSAGALMYECLTGRKPFEAATTIELLAAVRSRRPTPIRELLPSTDPTLATVIEQALESDPANRPDSAASMARLLMLPPAPPRALAPDRRSALRGILQRPDSRPPRSQRRTAQARDFLASHRRLLLQLAVATFAAVALILVVVYLGGSSIHLPPAKAPGASPGAMHTPAVAPPKGGGLPAPLARALNRLSQAVGR